MADQDEWHNPQFIADSQQMRGTAPLHPPEMDDLHVLRGLAHVQSERIAEQDGEIATSTHALRRSAETFKKTTDYLREVAIFNKQMVDLHLKMRHQLELLGADVSQYVIPEYPATPELQ